MPRVRDLGDEQRTGCVRDVAAHTHQPSPGKEHGLGVGAPGKRLDDGADYNEDTTDGGSMTATQVVRDVWGEEEDSEAAEAGKCS